MKPGEVSMRTLARVLLKHAAQVSPPERQVWAKAWMHELEHIPPGMSALRWALGCVWVSYGQRAQKISRSLTSLPTWLLSLEMTVCFLPLTLLFLAVLQGTARGNLRLEYGLLSVSVTLVGPMGLAVASRSLFLGVPPMGRPPATALALLALWTAAAYCAHILRLGSPLSAWREFILIAFLPGLAVAHLLQINSHRRTHSATT